MDKRVYEDRKEIFRRRLSEVGYDAIKMGLSPVDVAGSFWGTAHGIMCSQYGEQAARDYFTELAEEMQDESFEPFPGTPKVFNPPTDGVA